MQSITYNRTNSKIYLFMNQSAYVFLLLLTPEICCRLLRPFCFLPCPCPQSSLLFFFFFQSSTVYCTQNQLASLVIPYLYQALFHSSPSSLPYVTEANVNKNTLPVYSQPGDINEHRY